MKLDLENIVNIFMKMALQNNIPAVLQFIEIALSYVRTVFLNTEKVRNLTPSYYDGRTTKWLGSNGNRTGGNTETDAIRRA